MVNYSKWDNIDDSDEEADRKPQVHRFDAAQSVTIGGKGSNGAVEIAQSAAAQAVPAAAQAVPQDEGDDDEPMEPLDEDLDQMEPGEDTREDVLQCRALAERALSRGEGAEAVRLLEKAMRIGGADCPGLQAVLDAARRQVALSAGDKPVDVLVKSPAKAPAASNGGVVADRYFWSQTPETVEINVFAPDGTKAKAVAVKVTDEKLRIVVGGDVLFAGDWEFKVVPEEDPDWEMRDVGGRRTVRLTIRKAAMPGGMSIVVWWKRVLKGEPEIDVTEIEGRKREASESFTNAWKEAHVRFREKVQARTPIEIDMSGHEQDVDKAMEDVSVST